MVYHYFIVQTVKEQPPHKFVSSVFGVINVF